MIKSIVERKVNGVNVSVEEGRTLLQAIEKVGIETPRFCYHEELRVAGNCRMCRVERSKSPKPVASCAMPVAQGIEVFTERGLVKKAREGVLEIMLANHPLDCPICDQGGECDLQEQSREFGQDVRRYFEKKRSVGDKSLGKIVKTVMNRCIHCTRCVRFSREVVGLGTLGRRGRGGEIEIGTYVESELGSGLSGNLVDLCPVGALTSQSYSFRGRPWELRSVRTVDEGSSRGGFVRVDSRGDEIVRVLPGGEERMSAGWLRDETREGYDHRRVGRLERGWLEGEEIESVEAMVKSFAKLLVEEKGPIRCVLGENVGSVDGFLFKELVGRLGGLLYLSGEFLNNLSLRESCGWKSGFARLENRSNLRRMFEDRKREGRVFWAKVRKEWRKGELTLEGLGKREGSVSVGLRVEEGLNFREKERGGLRLIQEEVLLGRGEEGRSSILGKEGLVVWGGVNSEGLRRIGGFSKKEVRGWKNGLVIWVGCSQQEIKELEGVRNIYLQPSWTKESWDGLFVPVRGRYETEDFTLRLEGRLWERERVVFGPGLGLSLKSLVLALGWEIFGEQGALSKKRFNLLEVGSSDLAERVLFGEWGSIKRGGRVYGGILRGGKKEGTVEVHSRYENSLNLAKLGLSNSVNLSIC